MKSRYLTLAAVIVLAVLAALAVFYPDAVHHAVAMLTPDHAAGMVPHGIGVLMAKAPLFSWGAKVEKYERLRAEASLSMKALVAKAEAEKRDFTAEEQTAFDKHKAAAAHYGDLAEVEKQEVASRGRAGGRGLGNGHVKVANSYNITVTENIEGDPNRGFAHLGEQAQAIAAAEVNRKHGTGRPDQRLLSLQAAAPGTSGNESSGADGGFLIAPGFSTNVFVLSLDEDSLLALTDNMPVEGNSMQIPKDETTPWGTNGLRSYWQGEASAGTPTKPVLGMMDLRLKKLLGFAPVSGEMLNDSSGLNAYLPAKLATSIRWKTNDAILFGSGAGVPIGAMTALPNSQGAMVVVPKDSGQATNTLSVANVLNMFARLPPGSQKRAIWLVNNDAWPALASLTLGNYPMFMPMNAGLAPLQGDPVGTLLGRPVLISQHANSFSSQGDLMLVDLSYYQSITKAEGITTATSMHLYFDMDLAAFRVTFRLDGQPKLTATIAPAKGTNKLSPFVVLGAR